MAKWKYIDNPQDPEFKKYLEYIKAIPNDSNAAAMDTGYNILKLFIENSDLAVKYRRKIFNSTHTHDPLLIFRIRKEIAPFIIEKGLVAARTSTKVKAMECLILFCYIEKPDAVMVSGRHMFSA